jgi:hypothetical protein
MTTTASPATSAVTPRVSAGASSSVTATTPGMLPLLTAVDARTEAQRFAVRLATRSTPCRGSWSPTSSWLVWVEAARVTWRTRSPSTEPKGGSPLGDAAAGPRGGHRLPTVERWRCRRPGDIGRAHSPNFLFTRGGRGLRQLRWTLDLGAVTNVQAVLDRPCGAGVATGRAQ